MDTERKDARALSLIVMGRDVGVAMMDDVRLSM